jgi:3-phenylpropionate/trans-cinnamate dioxygenase ferredoxin reductase component
MAGGALIIGASLSGLRLAEQLRASGYAGPLTIAGAEAHMPYNRPPLSKDVLFENGAADPLARLTFNIRPTLAGVTWHLGSPATAADLDRRSVTLADGRQLDFDVLGIATGLTPRRLPFSGGEENRHVVRTIEDAVRLKAALVPGARVVVAGGGFIGCEVAASAVKCGCAVTVVEALPLPMARAIGQDLASAIKGFHEAQGVTFRLNSTIAGLACDPVNANRLRAVSLSDNSQLPADVLIEAVGSVCNTGWLAGNGLDLSDGLLTDNALRVEGRAEAAAAGDVARFPNPRYGATPRRVEHWAIPALTAKRAAQSLADTLLGRETLTKAFDPIPTFWSDQFGMRIQSIGMPSLAGTTSLIDGELSSLGQPHKGLAMGYRLGDALIGVIAIGMPSAKLAEYREMLTTQG